MRVSNKSWVKEKKEGDAFGMMVFVLPSPCYAGWKPGLLGIATFGEWWMNCWLFFACVHSFCFTYYTVFILAPEFSPLYSSDSIPHPSRAGSEWVSEWVMLLKPYLDSRLSGVSPMTITTHAQEQLKNNLTDSLLSVSGQGLKRCWVWNMGWVWMSHNWIISPGCRQMSELIRKVSSNPEVFIGLVTRNGLSQCN